MAPWQKGKKALALSHALLLGMLAIGLLAGCSSPGIAPANPSSPDSGAATLEFEGRLEPRQYGEVTVSHPARIEQVWVKEGDRVEAGAPLMRLDVYEQAESELDAAELEKVLAQQALDELYRTAEVALAEAIGEVRRVEKVQAYAEDRLASLERPKDPQRIEQVYANYLLAEKRLADAREDLRKTRQKYVNKNNIIWMFIDERDFKNLLIKMEKGLAITERRYWDAKEKYEELIAPVDEIDLAIARAELALANARLNQAERERDKLLSGPDPDAVQAAQARLQAAEAHLAAARIVLQSAQLTAPVSGTVVDLNIKPGEWAEPEQRLAVIADLSAWVAATQDLGETSVPEVRAGQAVYLGLDAYPQVDLQGTVESVSLYSIEEDGDVYYRAKIGIEQPDLPLHWGMTVRIRFEEPID